MAISFGKDAFTFVEQNAGDENQSKNPSGLAASPAFAFTPSFCDNAARNPAIRMHHEKNILSCFENRNEQLFADECDVGGGIRCERILSVHGWKDG